LANNDDDVANLKELGWRQGSVLPSSLFNQLAKDSGLVFIPGDHCAIIASQDCDVVNASYLAEPYVELIKAVRVEKMNGNFAFGKSGRKLQFELAGAAGPCTYELSIHERWRSDRRILEGTKPDQSIFLSEAEKMQLAGWLAKRYRRAAFPDAFNDRFSASLRSGEFHRLMKTWGHLISAVFLIVSPEEDLPPERHYRITAYATVPCERYADEQERLQDDFQPLFEDALQAIDGIEVVDAIVISDDTFTLADVLRTRKLDLDYMSYKNDDLVAED
jgi:hypothetical protein